ncbi:hypothetical protein KL942_002616 [Ogataea angusta]|uniref:Uncharacterized protein n=1 Tax=Pichia angusta TaxID=870730 RepID=A0ABQ7RZQ8_PICAN|nr:hypothetical protein KL942_002616 [Ogataea angusta]KAG7850573.1 hypothetical protein KL940_002133 [Ogataea angusta]
MECSWITGYRTRRIPAPVPPTTLWNATNANFWSRFPNMRLHIGVVVHPVVAAVPHSGRYGWVGFAFIFSPSIVNLPGWFDIKQAIHLVSLRPPAASVVSYPHS